MRGRQVEPCGEAGKAGSILLHIGNRLRRNQLGALAAKQVRVGNHEILDVPSLGEFRQIGCRLRL